MIDKENLPAIVREYAGYLLVIKGRSPKTIDEYCSDLQTFFRYMKQYFNKLSTNVPLKEIEISDIDINFIKKITIADIYSFFEYTITILNNSARSRSRKVSSIRTFFKYITNNKNYLENDPTIALELPKIKSDLPHFLSLDESIKLLKSINGSYFERNYAIIALFLNCGMRLSELVGINISDIKEDNFRITGKGNIERIVYMNEACKDAIKNYLSVRPVDGLIDKDALFISREKKRISPKTVQWIVKKFIEQSGLNSEIYSVHKLRHTAATLMFQNGVDIRVLQNVLGHKNLATTQIYTHVSDENMKNAINSNPLANQKQISNKTVKKKNNLI